MSKCKKNAIIIITVALIVVITLTVVLTNIQYEAKEHGLFSRAREILLKNFEKSELGLKTPLKRKIDSDNPMNLLNYYGNEPIADLWASIPDNQKPYTIMLLIPGQTLNYNSEVSLQNLESWADECELKKIPYAIQNINGESHMEARPPIAYLEERFASRHKYFYGLNAAELYNGVDWRGDSESDNSLYLIQNIKLCAKYGAFFIWTDTNRNYKNGMLMQWLENNESFYSTFKEYSDYICLLNKESIAHPSTYAVMQGLWLAGLAGNWGVASDWWHWQCDGDKKSLFDENNEYVDDEWEMIYSFPENMYVQSMMLVLSRGATCFKAEAPNFSTSYGGVPIAGFEYGISPLLDRLIDKTIKIPSKEDVFAATDFVVLGKENYNKSNYDMDESNLYPKNGNSGIVPLLPKNLRLEERKIFLDKGIKLVEKRMSNKEFLSMYGKNDADTYLTNTATDWYFINNVENDRAVKYANFQPKYTNAESVGINATEHTSAIISEKQDRLSFYISNYRTDKLNMYKNGTPEERDKIGWPAFVGKYLTIDENGNPKGVTDNILRETNIKIKGDFGGIEPDVILKNNPDGSGKNNRKFTFEKKFNKETGELSICIKHNGIVEFDVVLSESAKEYYPKQKDALKDNKLQNDNNVDNLIELTAEKIEDYENYTYFSYLVYDKAYEKAKVIIQERTYSAKEIQKAESELKKAKLNLVNIVNAKELCKQVLQSNPDDKIGMSLDLLLKEMCSAKKYVKGRANDLKYAAFYKYTNWDSEIKAKKRLIAKREKDLKEAIAKQ